MELHPKFSGLEISLALIPSLLEWRQMHSWKCAPCTQVTAQRISSTQIKMHVQSSYLWLWSTPSYANNRADEPRCCVVWSQCVSVCIQKQLLPLWSHSVIHCTIKKSRSVPCFLKLLVFFFVLLVLAISTSLNDKAGNIKYIQFAYSDNGNGF